VKSIHSYSLLPHLAMLSFRRVTCRVIIELRNLSLFDRISVTPPDEKYCEMMVLLGVACMNLRLKVEGR
jgi:hypothetical protein